jgi:hypothetical protein
MNKKIYKMMVMFVVGFGIFLITVGTAGACESCSEEELAAERCVEFDFDDNDGNAFDWVLRLERSEPSGEGYTYEYSLQRRPGGPCLDVLTRIIQLGNLTNVYNPLPQVLEGSYPIPSYISKDDGAGYLLRWDLSEPSSDLSLSSDKMSCCTGSLNFSVTITKLFSLARTKIKLRAASGVIGVGFIMGPGDFQQDLNKINRVTVDFSGDTETCEVERNNNGEVLKCDGFTPVLPENFKISGTILENGEEVSYECIPSDIDIQGNTLIFTCLGSCKVLVRNGGRTFWRVLPDAYCP